jgi:hypothetical protein
MNQSVEVLGGAAAGKLYSFGHRSRIFAVLFKYLYALNVERTR